METGSTGTYGTPAPASAGGSNVAPATRKVGQVSADARFLAKEVAGGRFGGVIEPAYDPNRVVLQRATGGFNSAIEFAARFCMWHFASRVRLHSISERITVAELGAFLATETANLRDPSVLDLAADTNSYLGYGLTLELEATDLTFSDPHRICVTFTGQLILNGETYAIDPGRFPRREKVREPFPDPLGPIERAEGERQGSDLGGGETTFAEEMAPRATAPFVGQQSRAEILDRPWMSFDRSIERAPEGGRPFLHLEPIAELGEVTLEVCADYRYNVDFDLKRVHVYADMRGATTTLTTPQSSDGKLFWQQFLTTEEQAMMRVGSAPQVPIVPTVSMVGVNPANVTVDEMPDFEARAEHVGARPRQALAVLIDAMAGCHGTVEDVQQFIGNNLFGVISDEWIVNRVFKHKWRLGGFLRAIELRQTIQIKRAGHDEDATLHGWMTLETLDIISIETESTARTDAIRLGGSASTRADAVILRDGTTVGPDKVDLGPPRPNPWTVFTGPAVNPALAPNPAMRAFQQRAHTDAFRYLARPFAGLPSDGAAPIAYTRTEGVTKQVFFLGSLSSSFD